MEERWGERERGRVGERWGEEGEMKGRVKERKGGDEMNEETREGGEIL